MSFHKVPVLVIFLILLLALVVPVSAYENITVFNQNYTALGEIPSNVMTANNQVSGADNITLSYDSDHLTLTSVYGNSGSLWVGGLTPAVTTKYSFLVNLSSSGTASYVYIEVGGVFLQLRKMATSVRVYNVFFNADGSLNSSQYSSVPDAGRPDPFYINVELDNVNKTVTTTVNGYIKTTTIYSETLPYAVPSDNLIRFTPAPGSGETQLILKIYNITQTIPKTGNITAMGDKSKMAFGLDLPHANSTIEDGVLLLTTNNGTGTVFYEDGSSAERDAMTQQLLNNGWELGLHFSQSLSSLSLVDAYAMIDSEYTNAQTKFGVNPTSWCSLSNSDNATHATYAFNTYGLIWRNGKGGISRHSNIGNIQNSSYNDWWGKAIDAGIIAKTFTHETDLTPAAIYSLDSTKFQDYVEGFALYNVTTEPFYNVYKTGMNQANAAFTENIASPYLLNFTAATNGYPAFVEADVPYDAGNFVYNITGGITGVNFSQSPDGNTQFYVDNESTYIISEDEITGFPPVASFTANLTSGTVPLAVGFTDTSTNTPTDWDWYIDDIKFSDLQNPEYTFTEAGVYDVSLYAANGASGDWENKTDYITVTKWYDLQCENQTGNITLALFFNSTTSLGWQWSDPVNITQIAEDGLFVTNFDNSSGSFIGTGYLPESWHRLRIYNETDFGQLNCTTDALPITPTPIPIMPSTESNVNPANLFQYWPYALLALGLVVVFKKW